MIRITERFNNGYTDCYKIYSDKGMKIKNKKNGNLYNTNKDIPLVIVAEKLTDFVETDVKNDDIKKD